MHACTHAPHTHTRARTCCCTHAGSRASREETKAAAAAYAAATSFQGLLVAQLMAASSRACAGLASCSTTSSSAWPFCPLAAPGVLRACACVGGCGCRASCCCCCCEARSSGSGPCAAAALTLQLVLMLGGLLPLQSGSHLGGGRSEARPARGSRPLLLLAPTVCSIGDAFKPHRRLQTKSRGKSHEEKAQTACNSSPRPTRCS